MPTTTVISKSAIMIQYHETYVRVTGDDANVLRQALFALHDLVWNGWYFEQKTRDQYQRWAEDLKRDLSFCAYRPGFYDQAEPQFLRIMSQMGVAVTLLPELPGEEAIAMQAAQMSGTPMPEWA